MGLFEFDDRKGTIHGACSGVSKSRRESWLLETTREAVEGLDHDNVGDD